MDVISNNKIYRIFADQIEPWAANISSRWMVVTKFRRTLQLCDGVGLTPQRAFRKSAKTANTKSQINLHAERSPKLMCVLSGHADLRFYDYELRVPKSTFLFIPAAVPNPMGESGHISEGNPSKFCEICWMQPLGDELHVWICYSEKDKHTTWQWGNILFSNQRPTLFLRLLYEEILSASGGEESLIPHLLRLFVAGVKREARVGNYLTLGQEPRPDWKVQVASDPIDQACEYVDAHYGSPVTIEKLARAVGMSRSLLALRFKEKTGQTVGEYLTKRRLDKAKELLRGSEWTVSIIGSLVGFKSSNYFHKFFRRHERCSPLEYRRAERKK